jgi:hypothetical protein
VRTIHTLKPAPADIWQNLIVIYGFPQFEFTLGTEVRIRGKIHKAHRDI